MDILKLLRAAKDKDASDVHLDVSVPPILRIDGALRSINGAKPLSGEDISQALNKLTDAEQQAEFEKNLELDFSCSIPDVGHLRGNAAQQRGAISLAIRILPLKIPTIDKLELPNICKQLALKQRGLVIVTGPTGSGKSTTLAAMINHLNNTERRHVVTIEDPIEYVHPSVKCSVTQRQLGSDTKSFANALKHILRHDPDVILVGEMRDLDTAAAVLTVAETGHLVLSTGHAPSATQAMERIIDLFPPDERHLASTRLASLLAGVLCQTLVPRASGTGRVAAVEIMLANPAVRNLIREGQIYQLPNVIRTHRDIGMITLDEALVNLYLKKVISGDTLVNFCNDRQEVEKLIGKVKIEF